MVIKKVNLHAFQNEEHAGFNTYLQEYINQYGAATLNVTDQAADHKTKLDDEKSVLDLVQKNTYSERLNTAEDARDYPIRGFFKVVKGMLPKNRLGAKLLNNMYVYEGTEHKHEAQQPKLIDINSYK